MKKVRGFSILEILIAMTILLVAISTVAMLAPGIQSTSVDSQMNIEALIRAQELIENEQALSRKDFKLVNSIATTTPDEYSQAVYVSNIDLLSKRVTAVVTWNAQYGRPQSVSLSTVVSDFQNAIGGDTCSSVLSGNWSSPQIVNSSKQLLGQNILGDATGTYTLTGIDVYQKRLYATVNESSNATTLKSPTTAVNKSGTGATPWTISPTSAVNASDSSSASVSLSGNAISNYLWVTGFGSTLNIPKGATILGISVVVRRNASSNTNVKDNQVRLIRPDGTTLSFDNQPSGSIWASSEADVSYGGTTDLWGEQWTSDDLNNPNFGVALSVKNTSSPSRSAFVDYVSVSVTYRKQLYVVDVSAPSNPAVLGSLQVATTTSPINAGFNGVAVATSTATGSYAFVATNSTAGQLQIVDVGATNPLVVGTYQIAGAPVANAIFYKDGYVYLGLANNPSGPELYILDVHNPLTIPALSVPNFTLEVGAGVNAIYVKNNKAYLATDDTAKELVIADVSDLAHPQLSGPGFNPPGSAPGQGKSAYTVGDTLYLGRYYTSSAPEFYILDTSTSTPSVEGSIDVGSGSNTWGVYGLITRDYLSFLLRGNTTSGNGALAIYNTKNPASISSVATVSLPNAGAPVALDCEGNYMYAASVPVTGANLGKGAISIISAP